MQTTRVTGSCGAWRKAGSATSPTRLCPDQRHRPLRRQALAALLQPRQRRLGAAERGRMAEGSDAKAIAAHSTHQRRRPRSAIAVQRHSSKDQSDALASAASRRLAPGR
ncbi:hypothetical protein [Xanthomonas graminis]|uniref:hypothetical protein n=1 Tax=Xanthomonas graminis TaxID=3390026 RepID=UPI0016409572|nr:hypothetical protein [Xanthomonas translucens]